MECFVSPEYITESHLGADTIYLIAMRSLASLSELHDGDLFNQRIMDHLIPYQSVWLNKDEAHHFLAEALMPKERPPWHRGVNYPEPCVLSVSIKEIKKLVAVIHPNCHLYIMDSPDA